MSIGVVQVNAILRQFLEGTMPLHRDNAIVCLHVVKHRICKDFF
jgi:hypothetical protein